MLFYGDDQVNRKFLADKFGFNLADIEKKPSFENKKKTIDRVNANRVKSGMGYGRRAHFYVTDPETKMKIPIRYAQSNNVVPKDGTINYQPRYVQFSGAKKAFKDDLDLAVFFFLCPENSLSPFRIGNESVSKGVKARFEFIDTKQRASEKKDRIYGMGKAIRHAEEANYTELIVLAKGMGRKGVDSLTEDELRADMMEFAAANPTIYLQKAQTEVTMIEGRVRHLADTGGIKLEKIGNARIWKWAKGNKEGQRITEVINQTEDAKNALVKYMLNNLNEHYTEINSVIGDLTSVQNAEKFLATKKAQEQVQSDVIGDNLPEHLRSDDDIEEPIDDIDLRKELHAEITGYRIDGKKASWVHVKEVQDAITKGEITRDQVRGFVKKNYGF